MRKLFFMFLSFLSRFLNLLRLKETKSELRFCPFKKYIDEKKKYGDGSLLSTLTLLLMGGLRRALDSLEIPGGILCLCTDCHFYGQRVQSFH